MKRFQLSCFSFFLFILGIFFVGENLMGYLTTLSGPTFSQDTTDKYLYFQGPENRLYKVASDSSEIVVASNDPEVNPVTWSSSDRTTLDAILLSSTATAISTPSIPGDGYVYFQEENNELAKVKADGSGDGFF